MLFLLLFLFLFFSNVLFYDISVRVLFKSEIVHFYVAVFITYFSTILNAVQCTLGSRYVYLCSAAANALKRVLQVTSYLNDLWARQVKMKERVAKLKEGLCGRLPCRSKARHNMCLNLQATGTRGIALLTDSSYSLRQMRPPG